jgi:hypothetical protein
MFILTSMVGRIDSVPRFQSRYTYTVGQRNYLALHIVNNNVSHHLNQGKRSAPWSKDSKLEIRGGGSDAQMLTRNGRRVSNRKSSETNFS